MRGLILLVASIGSILLVAPASAGYVDVTYSGTVDQVGPGGPASIVVGTPITFDAVFDTSKLVDRTASANAGFQSVFPGGPVFSSVETASLSDDPLASLTITVGGITFDKFDEANYGTPCGDMPLSTCPSGGLGSGDLPDVEYLNGAFAGVGNLFINSDGYTLDADPLADIGQRATDGHAFHVNHQAGDFDFVVSTGTLGDPFNTKFAAGDVDLTTLQITAVPEPATWAVLLAGFGLMLGLRRFGRRKF